MVMVYLFKVYLKTTDIGIDLLNLWGPQRGLVAYEKINLVLGGMVT